MFIFIFIQDKLLRGKDTVQNLISCGRNRVWEMKELDLAPVSRNQPGNREMNEMCRLSVRYLAVKNSMRFMSKLTGFVDKKIRLIDRLNAI